MAGARRSVKRSRLFLALAASALLVAAVAALLSRVPPPAGGEAAARSERVRGSVESAVSELGALPSDDLHRRTVGLGDKAYRRYMSTAELRDDTSYKDCIETLSRNLSVVGGKVQGYEIERREGESELTVEAGWNDAVSYRLGLRRPAGPLRAHLAIVIDDCGEATALSERFLDFPRPLTFAVIPGMRDGPAFADEAAARGFEIIVHVPMEPKDVERNDPGPYAVRVGDDLPRVREILAWSLGSVPHARGINNHMGSAATCDEGTMLPVMRFLRAGGLYFIDSVTHPDSIAADVAQRTGVRAASRDVFLDNENDVAYVRARIREATDVATVNGVAVAIGHVTRRATIEALEAALPEIEQAGVELVYASEVVR
jgi:hypothetical protein